MHLIKFKLAYSPREQGVQIRAHPIWVCISLKAMRDPRRRAPLFSAGLKIRGVGIQQS